MAERDQALKVVIKFKMGSNLGLVWPQRRHAPRLRQIFVMSLLGMAFFGRLQVARAENAPDSVASPSETPTEADYQRLIGQNPREPRFHEAYAGFLADVGGVQEALRQLQLTRQLEPANDRVAHSLGECDLQLGDIQGAFTNYRDAVILAPQDALYHFSLANLLFLFRKEVGPSEKDSIQEAMRHFAKASTLEPLNLEYARSYAETFYGLPQPMEADWKAAEKAWFHVLEIAPDKEFACINLARVSLKEGNKAAARQWLEKVHSPAYRPVREKISRQITQGNE
ncbi:MAG: hypothetical protein QM796_04440 [Chthoniobacteraceae bacterium]